ncbi:MAG TPA: bacillithiol biosynthesis cysteine-adding enzyme BshC [Longimicrobiales bacterium]|nr:bacillithiol biosynthesis cysteine-adding enzyme BshC [Longimicrobiales bacterium]
MSSVLPAAAAARTGLAIVVRALAGGGSLVRDYHAGLHLEPFFGGHPGDIDAYVRKAAEVDVRLGGAQRMRVAAAIEPLGDATHRLRSILDGNGYFITTGQQPALFGGPLYTLYKVLAAVQLADALEGRLGKPCLALFWIGADDHDWDEANHTHVIGARDYLQRLQVSAPADAAPVPMHERAWGGGVLRAVDELLGQLPQTVWARAVAEHVRDTYVPTATVAASFTATMRWLLDGQRVALVSSAHPLLRRAALPVLRREAERVREHAAAIARQTARLEAAGYRAQVALADGASNIMLLEETGRDRLLRTGAGWVTRRDRLAMHDDALRALLDAHPERFSPNVLLRPVVENAVFPTIAYVAGPAEVSYFAQIGCLFAEHGIAPPVVVPRRSVTLVEPAIARVLARLELDADALRLPFDQLLGELTRRQLPDRLRAALRDARAALLREYETLTEAALTVDASLRGPLTTARNEALQRLHHAEQKILRQLRRRNAVSAEQLRRAATHLQPGGAPQERMLSPLHYVAHYGPAFVDEVRASLDMSPVPVAQWRGPQCA